MRRINTSLHVETPCRNGAILVAFKSPGLPDPSGDTGAISALNSLRGLGWSDACKVAKRAFKATELVTIYRYSRTFLRHRSSVL